IAKRLNAQVKLSLEEALDFISTDELVEVTPLSVRMRKKDLTHEDRQRRRRREADKAADLG
ncbi:MAG: hypothetical protein IIC99_05425, partial [Chloroflexi bacterium]|nr:hypothetical protein [Chloroflexota bacterium]